MREQLLLLPAYLTAHLQLTLAALLLAVVISVPLGVLVTRMRRLEQPMLGLAGIIQTIPSLALLAMMVPLLSALRLPSIGYLPAFIGLVLYGLLPILRNTVTGLEGVDPAFVEAARGVGMTSGQRLLRVELPLALPVIIAGVRTSTVWTVGMATLSTPVGATSLGNYIFGGLQTRNLNAVLVGCVAAAAFALSLDGLIRLVVMGLQQRRRAVLSVALGALALLYLYAGVAMGRDLLKPDRERIIIGAKTFTEQYILSEILAGQVTRWTGWATNTAPSLGSTVAFDALRSNEIDAYVDYSGTIWATIMRRESSLANRSEILEEVARYLGNEYGILVVGALGFENAYALAMSREKAERLGIRRISDLASHAGRFTIGGDYEFFGRAEWRAIQKTYGLTFEGTRTMDSSLMYQAVAQGRVDVISAYSTDGRIAALDLLVLEDDRRAIPPYDAIILASARLQRRCPEAIHALRALIGQVDGDRMRRMNQAVDEEGQSPPRVAHTFLDDFQETVGR
ncbi:MAG: ABC transporter permease/substrate-binding protein [Planctomycetes bacterium]|nr:ABC transporter permease/substrate-binding protein [Planctomycetota bacterium]